MFTVHVNLEVRTSLDTTTSTSFIYDLITTTHYLLWVMGIVGIHRCGKERREPQQGKDKNSKNVEPKNGIELN